MRLAIGQCNMLIIKRKGKRKEGELNCDFNEVMNLHVEKQGNRCLIAVVGSEKRGLGQERRRERKSYWIVLELDMRGED
jgi:hypothetical protein